MWIMALTKFNTYWNLVGPLHFNRLFNMVRVCKLTGEIWIGRCNVSIELWDQHGSISLLKQTRGITLSKDFRVFWAQNQIFLGEFLYGFYFVYLLKCILKNKAYQNTFIISWFTFLYYKLILFLMHQILQIDS